MKLRPNRARLMTSPQAQKPEATPTALPKVRLASAPGVVVFGTTKGRQSEILTPSALSFLATLHRQFEQRRRDLLIDRLAEQKRYDAGALPDFLPETLEIREGDWKIAELPADLTDRRVEITGPVDRKMIINALNSGASVYMADFEDANSPTWANCIDGQVNLKDRWLNKITFTDPKSKKSYSIGANPAVLIVRPRGWHLVERHLRIDGAPISALLFDFGLYLFHNAKAILKRGTAPYFYLPKLETHQEARLWNDVFVAAQQLLGLPQGTIKATVLIETLPAAFQMHEILWELRQHVVGLNAGRWDYMFSFIKAFAHNPEYVLPDRSQLVMGKDFLGAYAQLLIDTCHPRGALAMGGMAAQIPVRNDPAANAAAFAKVRADKEREASAGHDGTWVAHPALVPIAKEVFDRVMPQANHLDSLPAAQTITRDMLLAIPQGSRTEAGFRENIRVGVQYIEAWLRGSGAVPIYNLMEDAATAEICRAQIWQWLKYEIALDSGVKTTPDFFERALKQEMQRIRREVGQAVFAKGRYAEAVELFRNLSLASEFAEFLTLAAYEMID
jgi:malate synthase